MKSVLGLMAAALLAQVRPLRQEQIDLLKAWIDQGAVLVAQPFLAVFRYGYE